jgi:hypothetical protein
LFYERGDAVEVLLGFDLVGLRHGEIRLGLGDRHLLARVLQIRFALREVAFGLLERRLIRTEIENIECVARVYFLAGAKQPFVDIPIHASAHVHRVSRVGLRGILGEYGHVRRAHRRNHHGLRRRNAARRSLCSGLAACGSETAKNKDSESNAH